MENRLMVKEGNLLAVFNSAHRVMKAESLLKEHRLPMLLMPAPRQLQTDCGLAIRFEEEHRESIMHDLEREQLLPEFVARYQSTEYVVIWNAKDTSSKETTEI